MILGLAIQNKIEIKANQKPCSFSDNKMANANEKGFVRLLSQNMASCSQADGIGADRGVKPAALEEDKPGVATDLLTDSELPGLLVQIMEEILKLANTEMMPQEKLTRLEEFVHQKCILPLSVTEEKNLPISRFINSLESGIAAVFAEIDLEPETAARLKAAILQKAQELLNTQVKEEKLGLITSGMPEPKTCKAPDSTRQLLMASGHSEEQEGGFSQLKEPYAKDVKELIQFEQLKTAGKKMEKVTKDQMPTDAALADKKDFIFAGENSRMSGEFKKGASLLNVPRQVPVNNQEVLAQIVKKADLMVKQGLSEMNIELKPEFLGKMTIKVVVEEGAVTAKFLAENIRVKQILESNMSALRQSLESQGLRVEKTEVNVQLNNGGLFDGSENSRHFMWQRPQSSGFTAGEGISDTVHQSLDSADYYESSAEGKKIYEDFVLGSTVSWLV